MDGWEFEIGRLPDGCPPAEAAPRNAELYHYCSAVPPADIDIVPAITVFPDKDFHPKECQAHGISLYGDIRDAMELRKYARFRKMVLTIVTLTEDDGCLQHTPAHDRPSHHTFWPFSQNKIRQNVRKA